MKDISLWIKPYRDGVEQQIRLDGDARRDVDAYFTRVEEFAMGCADHADFATKFMQSPLYQEYSGLFVKYQNLVVTGTGETVEEAVVSMQRQSREISDRERAKEMAEVEMNAAISHMLPDEVNRLRWGGARTLPVIGPIIQWIDNIKWIRNFKL